MRKERGFTLVEALVAIFLIVILIGFIFSIFSTTRQGLNLSENHVSAVILGRSILSEMYNLGYGNVTAVAWTTYMMSGLNAGNKWVMGFDYKVDVVNTSIYDDEQTVAVTVKWLEPHAQGTGSQSRQVVLESIFTDPNTR